MVIERSHLTLMVHSERYVMRVFYPDVDCPECVRYQLEQFHELKEESNLASVRIRNEYREIWYDWIVRDTIYHKRASWSQYMNSKYGRERMGEFHTLCSLRSAYQDFIRYELPAVRAMIELMICPIDELNEIHQWVCEVNYTGKGFPPNVWVNKISPRNFSEVILWRLIRGLPTEPQS